jgi:hypothetical protein
MPRCKVRWVKEQRVQTYQIFQVPVLQVSVPGQYNCCKKLLKVTTRQTLAEATCLPIFVQELRSLEIFIRDRDPVLSKGGSFVYHIGELNLDVSRLDRDVEQSEGGDHGGVNVDATGNMRPP